MYYGNFYKFFEEERLAKYDYLDLLDFYYPCRVYQYGNQFRANLDTKHNFVYLKEAFKEALCISKMLLKNKKHDKSKLNILSNGYFSINNTLSSLGYNVFSGPWWYRSSGLFVNDIKYVHNYFKHKNQIDRLSFQDVSSKKGNSLLAEMVSDTRKMLRDNDIRAVIASSTGAFANRLPLRAAKEEGIPTFVFLHGLPGDYIEDSSKVDFLIVWSEQLKDNFVRIANFPQERIFVSGHPYYQKIPSITLRNSLEDVLIINPNSSDCAPHDRGNAIYYLMAVEKTLRSFGVKKARFRPHPGENAEWYLNYVDKDFFYPDTGPLKEALEKSTLVIGTISTVLIESLFYGVNYLLFNPEGYGTYEFRLVPPFDGSDSYLPIANSIKELSDNISAHKYTDMKLFSEYVKTPFDISFIKDIIEKV